MYLLEEIRVVRSTHINEVSTVFGDRQGVEILSQPELIKLSREEELVKHTVEFTSQGNVILIFEAFDRWRSEAQ